MNLFNLHHINVVRLLIGVNVVFFVVSYLLPLFLPVNAPSGRGFLGLLPAPSYVSLGLLGWADIRLVLGGEWWVLVTAIFLHGGVIHILFNMLWVRELAPQAEIVFGKHGLLVVFIISGIFGNLVAVFSPLLLNVVFNASFPSAPVIGASGAVFGIMGSIVAFGRKRGGVFGRQIARQLGLWAVILIVMGFLFPDISNAAHIGGFIGGFLIGKIVPGRSNNGSPRWVFWAGSATIILTVASFLTMASRLITVVGSL